jgi:hypothetical protein
MRVAAALAVVCGLAGASRAEVPAPLARLLQSHCVRCHKEDSLLDLRSPPPESDTLTWRKIFEMVESSRMPPPARRGPIALRFPLDPGAREALLGLVAGVLGATLDPTVHPHHITDTVWRRTVEALASPVLTADRVRQLTAMPASPSPDGIGADEQTRFDEMAFATCEAIADGDLARPANARTYLAKLPARGLPASQSDLRATAATLLAAVNGIAPTNRDVDDSVQLLRRLHHVDPVWAKAWAGLCVFYLTSPRVWFDGYLSGAAQ